MGAFRLVWTVAIGFVLLGTSSASQFGDPPPQSMGETRVYQEGTDLDSGFHGADTSLVEEKNGLEQTEEEKALFLIKVMQALSMQNEDPRYYRSAIPESVDLLDIQDVPEGYGHDVDKPLMAKRLSTEPIPIVKTIIKPKSSYEAQLRWKAKKGTPMICYFKLCGFRPPL